MSITKYKPPKNNNLKNHDATCTVGTCACACPTINVLHSSSCDNGVALHANKTLHQINWEEK